jgi:hypothetical protein
MTAGLAGDDFLNYGYFKAISLLDPSYLLVFWAIDHHNAIQSFGGLLDPKAGFDQQGHHVNKVGRVLGLVK